MATQPPPKNRGLLLPFAAVVIVGIIAIVAGFATRGSSTGGPGPNQLAGGQSANPVVSAQTEDGIVLADPDFEEQLRRGGFSTRGWRTDFSLHTVDFSEITSGGPPRDGIPPIDDPKFTDLADANRWLNPKEPVISLTVNGETKAYPLQILIWHEIVNDTLGGVPVAVTFCPLCNSAITFDRNFNGQVLDFGTSGNLRFSDLVMWDRQTETWWQQFTGEAIVGRFAGRTLTFIPSAIVSWEDFQAAHPDATVLDKDTGFSRSYGQNPYAGYDRVDNPPFLFRGELNGRLLPKERVVAVTIGDESAAFPFSVLETELAVNYTVGGQDLVVFFKQGTLSALDSSSIDRSRDIGSTGVFDPHVDGQKLTFTSDGAVFIDNETGSHWNIEGQAIAGPLAGQSLTRILHADHFWFAWGAFRPDTLIYAGSAEG